MDEIIVKSQISGFKTMALGGCRLTIDLFENTPDATIAMIMLLSKDKAVIDMTIAPEGKPDGR